MPSLKEIKTRIASVNSTRKITSAMKMVASSKLHHAQVAIQNMLPYGNMLEHILKSFLVSTPNVDHPLQLEHKETKRVALVVYSSNSSLCGGFNSNVIKMMMHAVDEYKAQGIDDITVYPIGRKVAEKAQKLGLKIGGNFNDLAGFGAFMVSLWGLLPDIVRGLILAVAALFVIIGVIQLID